MLDMNKSSPRNWKQQKQIKNQKCVGGFELSLVTNFPRDTSVFWLNSVLIKDESYILLQTIYCDNITHSKMNNKSMTMS